MKFFCIAGPIIPEDHYCVPFTQQSYFVLHAPRQTGKTSLTTSLIQQINATEKYYAAYLNVQAARITHNDYIQGTRIILTELLSCISRQLPQETTIIQHIKTVLSNPHIITGATINGVLQKWALTSKKPLVLFIDEINTLSGNTLFSFLLQIRSGYQNRPHAFPHALCFISTLTPNAFTSWGPEKISLAEAFPTKISLLRLENFTREQIQSLYLQHTTETGQQFDSDAIDHAYELTQGQPWLVNALAHEACFKLETHRSYPITKQIIEKAKHIILNKRNTHFDSLIGKLHEPRVRNSLNTIFAGFDPSCIPSSSDLQYVKDLGFLTHDNNNLFLANPIYQEIIPRELAHITQKSNFPKG